MRPIKDGAADAGRPRGSAAMTDESPDRPSLRDRLRALVARVSEAFIHPADEVGRWERAVRFSYDLGRYGARQLKADRAPQMASALAFRSLFGLLPVLIVGTLLVKAVGGFDQYLESLRGMLEGLGLDDLEVQAAASGAEPGSEVAADGGQSLADWILGLVGQTERLNLAAITWIGVGVVIYSAISLLVTIEGAFNQICRAPEGRPWMSRFLVYWAVVTLGPAALIAATWVDHRFDLLIADLVAWRLLATVCSFAWNFSASWLVLFLVYRLMPNAAVQLRPAMLGALTAALLVEVLRRTLGIYLEHAVSFRQLYGSLGLIPIFMFWIYLMWLVTLFGLEVAATLQALAGRQLEQLETARRPGGLVEPAAVIDVAAIAASSFAEGRAVPERVIAERAAMPESAVAAIVRRLIEAGVLHRVAGEEPSVTLARPPASISAVALLEAGYDLVALPTAGGAERLDAVRDHLRAAQRAATEGRSLESLLLAR